MDWLNAGPPDHVQPNSAQPEVSKDNQNYTLVTCRGGSEVHMAKTLQLLIFQGNWSSIFNVKALGPECE